MQQETGLGPVQHSYGQLAPSVTARGAASPAHWISHVEPAPHDNEHEPVHRTVQLESAQLTLPLGPTVTSQLDWLLQLMLHDSPHSPLHSL